MKQNQTIDLLRFLAALMVCIFHFNEPIPFEDNWYRNLVKFGWLGVPIFFVISGFCIQLSLKKSSTLKFIFRRFFRIYPLYWASLLIVLSVVLFQKMYTGFNSVSVLPNNFTKIVATISLYIYPINSVTGINWVYWSLVCEVCFYILITISLLGDKKYHNLIILGVTVLSVVIRVEAKEIWYYPLKEWPAFVLGLAIAKIRLAHTPKFNLNNYVLLAVALIALANQNMFGTLKAPDYFIATLLTVIIIYISTIRDLKNNAISNMGKYSYAIYLIHVPMGVYLTTTLFNFARSSIIINIILDITIYLTLLLISKLIYHNIEVPSINLGKKIIETLKLR